jgi:hypothetical protein
MYIYSVVYNNSNYRLSQNQHSKSPALTAGLLIFAVQGMLLLKVSKLLKILLKYRCFQLGVGLKEELNFLIVH